MLADALLDLSNRGDSVIDPSLGSGSTLIAADKIGNVSRGVDLDSLYVEMIMRQYAAATGNPAVLIETGEAFNSLAREGQGRQRRSRAGFPDAPSAPGSLRNDGAVNPRERRYLEGQRFESPQLQSARAAVGPGHRQVDKNKTDRDDARGLTHLARTRLPWRRVRSRQ